jgi:molybdopterin-binding protein
MGDTGSPVYEPFHATAALTTRAPESPNGSTRIRLADGNTIATADPARGDVAVYPWDITLSTTLPRESALNVINGPIRNITELGNRVRLTVGPISAEITAESLHRLGLHSGQTVYASFKATGTRVAAEHTTRSEDRWSSAPATS